VEILIFRSTWRCHNFIHFKCNALFAPQRLAASAEEVAFNDPPGGAAEQMILNQHLARLLRHSKLSAFQRFVQGVRALLPLLDPIFDSVLDSIPASSIRAVRLPALCAGGACAVPCTLRLLLHASIPALAHQGILLHRTVHRYDRTNNDIFLMAQRRNGNAGTDFHSVLQTKIGVSICR